jgi:hypothetical protein
MLLLIEITTNGSNPPNQTFDQTGVNLNLTKEKTIWNLIIASVTSQTYNIT